MVTILPTSVVNVTLNFERDVTSLNVLHVVVGSSVYKMEFKEITAPASNDSMLDDGRGGGGPFSIMATPSLVGLMNASDADGAGEMAGFPTTTPLSLIVQSCSLVLLALLCLLGNLLLVLTIYRCLDLRTVGNYLILNLAALGIILAVVVLPTWVVTTWAQTAAEAAAAPLVGTDFCRVAALLMFMVFLEAILTLGGIALDRYGNICHPFRYAVTVSGKQAVMFIVVTWMLSALLSSLPLMGFGRYTFRGSELPICAVDFAYDARFSLLTVSVVVAPSCLVICVCYWQIFSVARSQARRVRNLETSVSQNESIHHHTNNNNAAAAAAAAAAEPSTSVPRGHQPHGLSSDTPNGHQVSTRPAAHVVPPPPPPPPRPRHKLWQIAAKSVKNSVRQMRAIRTVFTIIGCFLACWTPYIVLIFYALAAQYKPSYALEFTVTFLALANYVANPVICVSMNKEFRKGVRKVLGLHRKRLMEEVISAWMSAARSLTRRDSQASTLTKAMATVYPE